MKAMKAEIYGEIDSYGRGLTDSYKWNDITPITSWLYNYLSV